MIGTFRSSTKIVSMVSCCMVLPLLCWASILPECLHVSLKMWSDFKPLFVDWLFDHNYTSNNGGHSGMGGVMH